MDDKELEEKIRTMSFSSGKNSMTLDDMATIQPGLARIMPQIGARTWKLYYAAKAENWPMAKFQYKEIIGLFELGAFMRPKHEAAINQYLAENWKPLEEPIANKDFAAFETAPSKLAATVPASAAILRSPSSADGVQAIQALTTKQKSVRIELTGLKVIDDPHDRNHS